jgi:hypothetical protein
MFVSDFVADPKSTLETFNSLSVTPAALLAVIARELKDAFKDINAIKRSLKPLMSPVRLMFKTPPRLHHWWFRLTRSWKKWT